MPKIVFLADVHAGASNKQHDIMWALDFVRRHCLDNDIDVVVVLGDLFHDRESISIEVLCDIHSFFKKCKEDGLTWIVFPGNHDMFLKYSWDVNSLVPFSDVLTVIDSVKILDIEGSRFWVLPFIHSESAYMNVLRKIEEHYVDGDVLLTHIGVKSSTLNICFLLQDWSFVDFTDSKFDRVYTGHFHIGQQVGRNVWYPGSLIPFKFDEGDSDHGFYEYDTNTRQHKFVSIWSVPSKDAPPQYLTLADTLLDEKAENEISNNVIRVATSREYSPNEKEEIRLKLSSMGARKVTFLDLTKYDQHDVVIEENLDTIKIDELFREFVEADKSGTKDLRTNLLLKLDIEIRQEGDDIYSRQEYD